MLPTTNDSITSVAIGAAKKASTATIMTIGITELIASFIFSRNNFFFNMIFSVFFKKSASEQIAKY